MEFVTWNKMRKGYSMNSIKQWFASKGGYAHVFAAIFVGAMAAYAAVPQFHALVNQIHDALPAWIQELATTGLALWAWYKTTQSRAVTVASAKQILASPDAPTAAEINSATPNQ